MDILKKFDKVFKVIKIIAIVYVIILAIYAIFSAFTVYTLPNEYTVVKQFGRVVDIKSNTYGYTITIKVEDGFVYVYAKK